MKPFALSTATGGRKKEKTTELDQIGVYSFTYLQYLRQVLRIATYGMYGHCAVPVHLSIHFEQICSLIFFSPPSLLYLFFLLFKRDIDYYFQLSFTLNLWIEGSTIFFFGMKGAS